MVKLTTMALINCPECGTVVSDKAEKCPKCAHPISYSPPPIHQIQNVEVRSKGCFKQTLGVGLAILLIIVVIFAILIWFIYF